MIAPLRAVAHPWLCDVMGHLTTRHYMAMFDDASYHALNAVFGWSGSDAEAGGTGFVDVRHEIDYVAEVRAGDLLEIRSRLDRLGGNGLLALPPLEGVKSLGVHDVLFGLPGVFTVVALPLYQVLGDATAVGALPL